MSNPKLYNLKKFVNHSGRLIPLTFNKDFPMKVKRIFFIYGKKEYSRGNHAHKKCAQFLIPVYGAFKISLQYKSKKKVYFVNQKNSKSLFVPPKIWCKIDFLKKNSILLVLANYDYDFNDYIETMDEFFKFEKNKK
jgi:UDP-2-acetamido-3-amino-2,3-dideoxy-glucuronate N-acetyltransferase